MDILSLIAGFIGPNGQGGGFTFTESRHIRFAYVELAKVQSTEASNAIEGIVTTSTQPPAVSG